MSSYLRITPRQLAVLALSSAEARRIAPSETLFPLEGAAQATSLAMLPRCFDNCEALSGSWYCCKETRGERGGRNWVGDGHANKGRAWTQTPKSCKLKITSKTKLGDTGEEVSILDCRFNQQFPPRNLEAFKSGVLTVCSSLQDIQSS